MTRWQIFVSHMLRFEYVCIKELQMVTILLQSVRGVFSMPNNLDALQNCHLCYTADVKFPTQKPLSMQFFIPIFAGLEQYFEVITVAMPFYLAALKSQMLTLL